MTSRLRAAFALWCAYAASFFVSGCGSDSSGGASAACAPREAGDVAVALQYSSALGSGNGSSAWWPAAPASPSFPVTIDVEVGAVRSIGDSETPVPVTQAEVRIQSSSPCTMSAPGPTCTAGNCTFQLVSTAYGICSIRIEVHIEDGSVLGACWYSAVFENAANMEADQAALEGARARCAECRI